MKKSLYSILIIIISIITVGCGITKNETIQPDHGNTSNIDTKTQAENIYEDDLSHDRDHGAKLAGTRIALQNANNLKPGEITLAFKLYGIDAHEFGPADLKIFHEKPMHLILLRDDVTDFQHVHPEYIDGRWTVMIKVASQGMYQMYVDVEPVEELPTTLRIPITIGGGTEQPKFPNVATDMTTIVDGIGASLQLSSQPKTGESTKLTFVLTKLGKQVNQIDPYLGAFGHVVVMRHGDADDYLHGHPITDSQPTDGKVLFEVKFPAKGTYTIFAQFNIAGQIKTFPITISVETVGLVPTDHKEKVN